jgi:hypothetical protein
MASEFRQVLAVDIIIAFVNFFTELLHPKFRSSVRRISVPSRVAEVSS